MSYFEIAFYTVSAIFLVCWFLASCWLVYCLAKIKPSNPPADPGALTVKYGAFYDSPRGKHLLPVASNDTENPNP